MPFCPECGKSVAPRAKFCRNCGASQMEESPSVTPVVPEPAAVPPQESPGRTCDSCGSPLGPDEKFCGICGASADVPLETTPPEPVEIPPAAQPVCGSCGSPLSADERFCGVCGARVGGKAPEPAPGEPAVAVAPAEPHLPPPAYTPPEPAFPPPPPPPAYSPAPGAPSGDRLCRTCGSPIKPGAKFCGKCCARVQEDTEGAGQPPAFVPVPPPPPVQPAAFSRTVPATPEPREGRSCRTCGTVIPPGAKFCPKCLARVVDTPEVPGVPSASAAFSPPPPPPPPQHTAAPVPVPSAMASPGGRVCRSCGNVMKPGDRFCAKCCAKVVDEVPPAPAGFVPVPPPPPPASPVRTCPSCGSTATGDEKFCGICGTAMVSAPVPVPPPPPPAGAFCASCGQPLGAATRFCGSCGAPVAPSGPVNPVPVPPAPPIPKAASPGGEQVIGVIGNAKKMKMFGASWDTYTIIITDQRMILAQMTQEMINAAIREAQAKAKEEGKGLLSQMMHQMSAMFQYSQRYFTIPPDQVLAENPGNRGIGNRSITSIKLKVHESGSGGAEYSEFRMIIEAPEGKFEFMIAEDDRFSTLLKEVYGEKVHMPFGYFSKGGMRIKLF